MCDESRIIAGENEILSKTPRIKNPRHENIAFNAANDHAFPVRSELPNQKQIEGLYKKGRKFWECLAKMAWHGTVVKGKGTLG